MRHPSQNVSQLPFARSVEFPCVLYYRREIFGKLLPGGRQGLILCCPTKGNVGATIKWIMDLARCDKLAIQLQSPRPYRSSGQRAFKNSFWTISHRGAGILTNNWRYRPYIRSQIGATEITRQMALSYPCYRQITLGCRSGSQQGIHGMANDPAHRSNWNPRFNLYEDKFYWPPSWPKKVKSTGISRL